MNHYGLDRDVQSIVDRWDSPVPLLFIYATLQLRNDTSCFSVNRCLHMNCVGGTEIAGFNSVPDLMVGASTMSLRSAFYYRYCYVYYSLQTIVGEGTSS